MSSGLFDLLARVVNSKIARARLRQKTYPEFVRSYGKFRIGEEWRSLSVKGIDNESGGIFGQVVKTIQDMKKPIASVLLAGEGAKAREIYAAAIGVAPGIIVTAGLHDDTDHRWDFEESPPEMGFFDCVVSHAMLEHLVDPYRHMRDLGGLLAPGGQLVVYTVTPGFPYHRHPVDCMRFFPDWFEEVGKRMNLTVQDRFIGDDHIVYRYLKP